MRLPPFPVEAFPHSLRHFCESVAEATQTPVEMTAITMLGALSTVALGAHVDAGNGWEEELCFYALVVMDAAERKSSVMRLVTRPLRELEQQQRDDERDRLREERSRKEVFENRRRELLRKYSKTEGAEDRKAIWEEIMDTDKQLAMFGELLPFRLLADDVTAEGLSWLLAQHGRMGILAAEGSAIDNIVGARYSSEGKAAKLDIVLKAYNGESHTVDRRGRDSEHAEKPLLAIALAIQPEYLGGLIDHSRSRSLGLVSRFAFVIPRTRAGERVAEPEPVDPNWSEAWASTLGHVHKYLLKENSSQNSQNGGFGSFGSASLNKGFGTSLSLSLSSQAKQRLRELQRDIEPKLGPAGELAHIKDWAGRHLGRVLRIAGLLHLAARNTAADPIELEIFERAEMIGDFLMAHGRGALEEPDTSTLRARQVLERWGEDTISLRELRRQVFHGRGPTEQATRLALQLVDEGMLEHMAPEKKAGRPSIAYRIVR